MAIVKCKECGAEVAQTAKTCTQCGVKDPGSRWWHAVLGLVIVVGLSYGVGVWLFDGGSGPESSELPVNTAKTSYLEESIDIDLNGAFAKYADRERGGVLEVVEPHLKPWSPIDVTFKEGRLIITLPQDKITYDIYQAVINSGVCASLWTSGNVWIGVTDVLVMNRHKAQGYLFEGGEKECAFLGTLSNGELYLQGNTRMM